MKRRECAICGKNDRIWKFYMCAEHRRMIKKIQKEYQEKNKPAE